MIDRPIASVLVEVDMYSGRENPMWQLETADAAQFQARVQAATPGGAEHSDSAETLGYRGLRVVATSIDAIERYVIGGGTATIDSTSSADRQIFGDADRSLEKWLLRTGKQQLGPALLAYLLAQ